MIKVTRKQFQAWKETPWLDELINGFLQNAENQIKGASETVLICPPDKLEDMRFNAQMAAAEYRSWSMIATLRFEDLPEDIQEDVSQIDG